MSKRFKGKLCVYCCEATSATGDHVFARRLFLESRRQNIPQVPACERCNTQKSNLEHYLASVLPFGGHHSDAALNLRTMVPSRLAKNPPLHAQLRATSHDRTKRVWARERGLLVRTIAVPFDWPKLEQWLKYVVKGLSWHHWKVPITPDCGIDVFWLTQHREAPFQRLLAMTAAERVCQDVGAGTFSYKAAQGIDSPKVSVWEFSIYGGIKLGASHTAPRQTGSKIGAMVGPKSMLDKEEKRLDAANWPAGLLKPPQRHVRQAQGQV